MSQCRSHMDISAKQHVIHVALGHEKADLVLKQAKYLNVFTDSWEQGDIAIADGRIAGIGDYQGKAEVSASGQYVVPGFMDAHIHLESSLVSPAEFCRAVLPCGTTGLVADPHEIANVLGKDGIDYMMQATENLPLDVWLMIPSCVPATEEDESGASLTCEDIAPYLSDPRVLGLAEMMNYPGVLSGSEDVLCKIAAAHAAGKYVDGHAPGLLGKELNAYIASGISSDHECSTLEEALEKLRKGQWIMIREGTAARNLEALVPLLSGATAQRCLFATDDKHPEDLLRQGHMQWIVAKAVRLGASPIAALKAASFNQVRAFALQGYGAIAPGYMADLALLSDLTNFNVTMTLKHGQIVYDGKDIRIPQQSLDPALAQRVLHTFRMPEVTPEQFIREAPAGVLQMVAGQIVTEDGGMASGIDLERGILKIAVMERHHATGHVGIGYLRGYGLRRGAIATSVAHDSHNLIVAGASEQDMAVAANRVRELEGGIAAVLDGKVLEELALPIAGLMSAAPLAHVNEALERLKGAAHSLGVGEGIDPFMTLSFMSLPVIPALRILTRGVFDVTQWKYRSQ